MTRSLSCVIALGLALGSWATALPPHTDLEIVNAAIAPDGFERSATLAGGVFPGPLIAAEKGDVFRINVIDNLTDGSMLKSTTVHWHGIFQRGSNWADGPAGVNQCPIAPGHSFLYEFEGGDQTGTYWYHSHHSSQYCDGLRGALVVYDPNDPFKSMYDVDDESTIITVADWYHIPAKEVGFIAYPDSILINGRGRYAGGPPVDLSVVTVEQGKRYRMRLISMACDPYFTFQIDGHDMTIIEVDGINHQPYTVDALEIFAGQRYSFILNANNPIGNYWIRANPSSASPGYAGGGFDSNRNMAILRYTGAPSLEPSTQQAAIINPLIESRLAPLVPVRAPGRPVVDGADININLNVTADIDKGIFYINNSTFIPPTVPVLLQIMSGEYAAQELLPAGVVYEIGRGKSVQLSFPAGAAGGFHPLHLHGHSFSVVRSAGQADYNFDNPPVRDGVSMGATGDNVTIRFETDNPGPWFLHCHIDWHLEHGFAVVFAEGMENPQSVPLMEDMPEAWQQLCPIYDALASEDH